ERAEGLSRGEAPTAPRLGVAIAPPRAARRMRRAVGLPERSGLLVRAVEDGSPAAAGGLHLGDVIVELDGQPVTDPEDLRAALADRAGAGVAARLLRAGQLTDVQLAVGQRGGR
ncbi:MAG TPA: PDZ domain-containing protein, partial [Kofleriaceae bacterium]|nr:PDZ domain-containing protein [Kofleriaceae bacterium]